MQPENVRLLLPTIQEDSCVNHGRRGEPVNRKRWSTLADVPSVLVALPFACAGMLLLMVVLTQPVEDRSPLKEHGLESRLADWEEWKRKFHDAFHQTEHSVEDLINVTTDLLKNLTDIPNCDEEDVMQGPVYLNHSFAYGLLARSMNNNFFLISQGWDAQVNQAYCAVATTAALLNSFRGHIDLPIDPAYSPFAYATQHNLWNKCTSHKVIRRSHNYDGILEAPGGLGMDQTKLLLECNLPEDFSVKAVHLDPSAVSVDAMRQDLKEAIESDDARVMINYNRVSANQVGGGHWSPLGSYNVERDAFLVMDVAKYKYPPAWITTDLLYASLSTFDPCGTWGFPTAQKDIPITLQNPSTQEEFQEVMTILGCQATRRGYIVVRKNPTSYE